jgi:hypothetical protein
MIIVSFRHNEVTIRLGKVRFFIGVLIFTSIDTTNTQGVGSIFEMLLDSGFQILEMQEGAKLS